MEKRLKETKTEDPSAVYKKEVHEEEMPRKLKQLQNLRYKGNSEMRIFLDTMYDMQALARDTSNQLINIIQTHSNLIVICGMSLWWKKSETCSVVWLTYSSTFQVGDFYKSSLIFRHIFFKEMPCMAALFMIHKRRFQKHHEAL